MNIRNIDIQLTDARAGLSRAHASDAGLRPALHRGRETRPAYARIRAYRRAYGALGGLRGSLVCSRSGLARSRGVCVLNDPGVIDPGYQGDVGVVLFNASDEPVSFAAGDRIAQLLIVPVATPDVTVVESFDAPTERGVDGFGSTGV